MKRAFEIGDTVTLKSGGHLMTIISIDRKSTTCAWSVKGDIKSKSFPSAALKKADASPPIEQLLEQLSVDDQRALAEALEAHAAESEQR